MIAVGGKGGVRSLAVALTLVVGTAAMSGCGSSADGDAADTTAAGRGTTTVDGGEIPEASTTVPAPSTTILPSTSLPDATESQRSGPDNGMGIALLKAVRVGRHPGFERIVFEFAGEARPGYRVQWVDGPITADGSGEPVEVDGKAFLEIVMSPASGVDLSAPQLTVVYDGPDRIPVADQTELITDLVRTGDFEAVLSWAAGTTERVPFRVVTFADPSRIAIDLQVPDA